MHRLALAAFVIGTLFSWSASATGVELVAGQVSINRGDGYQPLVDWAPAFPGDLVMASPDGSGKIEYADGCVVEVTPGAVIAVQDKSPCGSGGAGFKPGYLIGGVLIAGGIAGGLVLLSGGSDDDNSASKLLDDDDDPASP